MVRMFLSLASLCMVSRVNVPYSPWFDEETPEPLRYDCYIPKSNSIGSVQTTAVIRPVFLILISHFLLLTTSLTILDYLFCLYVIKAMFG